MTSTRQVTRIERALVLRITPNGESFQKIDILTRESGYILCLKRISKKTLSQTTPDLFDTTDIILESSHQGTTRFIKEYQLLQRRSAIGQSYRKLHHASEFCALIVQNAPHMADPLILHKITERTLNAFAEKESPEITSLKALYILLKDEGYPVRESWWPQLPTHLKEPARQFINNPLPESTSEKQTKRCMEIEQNLRNWLSHATDLMLP